MHKLAHGHASAMEHTNVAEHRHPQWTVQDRLRKARESAGLSVADLADRLAVHRNTVTGWEHANKKRGVPRTVLLAYSAETGVDVEWLERGDEYAPAEQGIGYSGWMLPTCAGAEVGSRASPAAA